MTGIFAGLSEPVLVAGVLDLLVVVGLYWMIRLQYQDSLTSVEEKSAGPLHYYRARLAGFFSGNFGKANILVLFHYIGMHLLVPVLGLGLFLGTDWNFVALVLGLVASYQLLHRVYPGALEEEHEEN